MMLQQLFCVKMSASINDNDDDDDYKNNDDNYDDDPNNKNNLTDSFIKVCLTPKYSFC